MDKILFMNSQKHFKQKEIDDYISLNCINYKNKHKESAGISVSTLSIIQEHISKANEPFTAEQLAHEINLSRITVRRYLENMVDNGELDTNMEYGNIGRPRKLYIKK